MCPVYSVTDVAGLYKLYSPSPLQGDGVKVSCQGNENYIPSPLQGEVRVGVDHQTQETFSPHPNLPPSRGKEKNILSPLRGEEKNNYFPLAGGRKNNSLPLAGGGRGWG